MLDRLYAGAGGPAQTATFPQLDPTTWNGMDLGYKRRDDGFNFEFQGESREGTLIGQYKSSGVRPHFTKRAAYFGLERALQQAMLT